MHFFFYPIGLFPLPDWTLDFPAVIYNRPSALARAALLSSGEFRMRVTADNVLMRAIVLHPIRPVRACSTASPGY